MSRRSPKPGWATKGKKLTSTVWVGRTKGLTTFSACMRDRKTWGGIWCVSGQKNPRKALAALYRAAAARLAKRKGAFAGRRRRSRR